jgi:hypothetical protein
MADNEDEDREAKTRRVLREARETLRRTQRLREVERAKHEIEEMEPDAAAHVLIPAPEDRVTRWRKDAEARAAAREEVRAQERARTDLIYKQFENKSTVNDNSDAWNKWLTEYVERRLEQERELIWDVVGQAFAGLIEEHRKADHRDTGLAGEISTLWKAIGST